ncbi:uncharacterized protein LOC115663078 [Syzygium oleosum]|uniref:uncharacterized protein LOC115663078 n=1 Tax=Syzygium oleosum TaxID=219896 RepID=UPI0011D1CEAC|nr:uncharacterized protein LOC115663078 [Syzygium oleosum]
MAPEVLAKAKQAKVLPQHPSLAIVDSSDATLRTTLSMVPAKFNTQAAPVEAGTSYATAPQGQRTYRRGSITILRVPMILQQWHPALKMKKNHHESLPVWVKLRDIPYALWSVAGISTIASAIGKPLHVDMQTEKMRMISYAIVCVEIKANQKILASVEVIINDESWTIVVEFEWRPVSCMTCGTFDHRCPPPSVVHIATQNDPTPAAAADTIPPARGDKWETIKKKNGAGQTRVPAVTPSPGISFKSLEPKSSMVEKSLPDLGLPSPATSMDSSDSEDTDKELANNIGSDSEKDPSPAPPHTRSRSVLNPGDATDMGSRDTPLLAPALAPPNPNSSPSTIKMPISKKKWVGKKRR